MKIYTFPHYHDFIEQLLLHCVKAPWVASGDDSKGLASMVNMRRLYPSLGPTKDAKIPNIPITLLGQYITF